MSKGSWGSVAIITNTGQWLTRWCPFWDPPLCPVCITFPPLGQYSVSLSTYKWVSWLRCWGCLAISLTFPHLNFQCEIVVVRVQSQDSHGREPPTSPVPPGIVQSAACPQGLIVIVAPAEEGQCCPEGGRQPHKEHQGYSCVPCQSAACVDRRRGWLTGGNSYQSEKEWTFWLWRMALNPGSDA